MIVLKTDKIQKQNKNKLSKHKNENRLKFDYAILRYNKKIFYDYEYKLHEILECDNMIKLINTNEITLEEVSVKFTQSTKKIIEVVIPKKISNKPEPWYQKDKNLIKQLKFNQNKKYQLWVRDKPNQEKYNDYVTSRKRLKILRTTAQNEYWNE